MKYHLLYFVIHVVYSVTQVLCVNENYYWREYTGTIPSDAVVGGRDVNGQHIYIGQTYVKDGGLIVVKITPGVIEMEAPYYGAVKVDRFTKILCGPQENFYWLPAKNTELDVILIDRHAVIGGHEDNGGYLSIGRINYEGEIKIPKVNSWITGNATAYFVHQNGEYHATSYEILIYDTL